MNKIFVNYKKSFKNYLNFKDKSTPEEFWLFVLANLTVSAILSGITILIHRGILVGADYSPAINIVALIFSGLLILQALYVIAIIIPSLALAVRCLRNANGGGVLYLLALVPVYLIPIIFVFVSLLWYQ
ncbi:hypothetical protein SDC9_147571 [bioreactor metagenome]|uniref:Inner membrane protein YhaI n=1 Tax=bioreactor metagenome TaxID=1076179 RepID=A0A645EF27_9ZZZZ